MSVAQSIIIIDSAKIVLSLVILLYASWSDYKTREVSNRLWAIYAPIALGLSLIQLVFYEPAMLPYFGLSVGFTVVFSLLLFYTGGFGGADSKAFMCIALALPFTPAPQAGYPLIAGELSVIADYIFPFTILTNAVLFAAASVIYLVIRNIVWHKKKGITMFEDTLKTESIFKKILVLITGYRIQISKLKQKWHIFPMEDVETTERDVKRKLVIIPKDEGREKIVERLSDAIDSGKIKDYVWATPGLPMLIFVTFGFIFALLFGDIVWMVLMLILG